MSKFIISVENIYKRDYLVPEEDIEAAVKDAVDVSLEHMKNHYYGDLAVANFYIRLASDPENEKHLFGTITTDECEECTCPMCEEKDDRCCGEMCAACDEDCDNCPFDNICDMYEDAPDDAEDDEDGEDDESPSEEIMAYLALITDRLESLTSLLEKVCKVSPKE